MKQFELLCNYYQSNIIIDMKLYKNDKNYEKIKNIFNYDNNGNWVSYLLTFIILLPNVKKIFILNDILISETFFHLLHSRFFGITLLSSKLKVITIKNPIIKYQIFDINNCIQKYSKPLFKRYWSMQNIDDKTFNKSIKRLKHLMNYLKNID